MRQIEPVKGGEAGRDEIGNMIAGSWVDVESF